MGNSAGTLGTGLVIGLVVGLGGGFLLFGSGDPVAGLAGESGSLVHIARANDVRRRKFLPSLVKP